MHTEIFTQKSFYIQQTFAQRNFSTEELTHRNVYTDKLLHTAGFCTEKLLHREPFTHRSSYTEQFLHMIAPTIAPPKPDLDAKAEKCTILKAFLIRFLRGKSEALKCRKLTHTLPSGPSCSHSITNYDV